jgi:hypothetical protein
MGNIGAWIVALIVGALLFGWNTGFLEQWLQGNAPTV